jgi:hypothetical protein
MCLSQATIRTAHRKMIRAATLSIGLMSYSKSDVHYLKVSVRLVNEIMVDR